MRATDHRLRHHWKFLLFGFLMTWGTFPGQTFFFSLFNREIRTDFGLSHGDFGFYYLLATLSSAAALTVAGGWLDRLPLKLWTYAVLALLLLAATGFALAPNLVIFTGCIFLLRFSGQGLLSHTAITSMGRYFTHLRGRALAIAGLGYPAAESTLPFIVPLLLAAMDWRDAWLLIVAVVGLVLLPAVQLLLGRARVFGELAENENRIDDSGELLELHGLTRRQMLRSGRFYLLAPMVITPSFLITAWFFHHQHVAAERGWSLAEIAPAFTAYAGAAVLFNLICGALVDRFAARRMLWLPLLPLTASGLPLMTELPPWSGWVAFALMGMNNGAVGTILNAAWAELFGVRHLGAIKALATALMVFGSALAPFAMGLMFDAGLSVATVAGYAVAMAGLVAICGLALSLSRDESPKAAFGS